MAMDLRVPIILQILIKCWHMLPKKLTTKKKMLLIPRSKERCGISLHYFTHSREKKADSSAVKHDFWPQFSTKLWMKEKKRRWKNQACSWCSKSLEWSLEFDLKILVPHYAIIIWSSLLIRSHPAFQHMEHRSWSFWHFLTVSINHFSITRLGLLLQKESCAQGSS